MALGVKVQHNWYNTISTIQYNTGLAMHHAVSFVTPVSDIIQGRRISDGQGLRTQQWGHIARSITMQFSSRGPDTTLLPQLQLCASARRLWAVPSVTRRQWHQMTVTRDTTNRGSRWVVGATDAAESQAAHVRMSSPTRRVTRV